MCNHKIKNLNDTSPFQYVDNPVKNVFSFPLRGRCKSSPVEGVKVEF